MRSTRFSTVRHATPSAPFALPGLLLLAVELVLLAPAALAIVCYLAASEGFASKPEAPFVDDPTATFEKYPND